MGLFFAQVNDPRGIFLRAWQRTPWLIFVFGGALLTFFSSAASESKRDPKQRTTFVTDYDGTFALNVGNYRLRRVFQLETPLFQTISGLPEEVRVPVQDFEGNTGPRIGLRLGRRDEKGHFTPSTSQEPIRLSNGETIIPAFYYLDPETSYIEFRTVGDPAKGHLVKAVQAKLKGKEPFLLEAFPFLAMAHSKAYKDQIQGIYLSVRGHDPVEMKIADQKLFSAFDLNKTDWPEEAYVNLGHPKFAEFSRSKVRYIRKLYHELTNRMMADKSVPHYLVVFENDRKHLRDIHDALENLSHQGIFANPVVPILVNLVEPEVFEKPDGLHWDDNPMKQITRMSRVSVYLPDGIVRTNDLSYVLHLSLGLEPKKAQALLAKYSKSKFICRRSLLD